ncbi:HD domain-containing protein [Nocardia sp. NPDC004151]|uniref:HD domain-containing protein n=1 Tax=Nocardia sp. NPDC004151 TaxID=3364304 RepID=UPI00367FA920
MIGDDIEEAARCFARAAHGGQTYGGAPYSVHLAAVRDVLDDFGFSGDLGVAAWLHDVLEDTAATGAELEGAFGVGVAELVWAVTGIGGTREERNEDIYAKIAGCPSAVILKLADRIANVEASVGTRWFAMYASEQQAFRAHLGSILDGEKAVGQMWARLEGVLAMTSREATVRQVLERWRGREAPDGDSIVFGDGTLVTMSLVRRRFQQPGGGVSKPDEWFWQEHFRASAWSAVEWIDVDATFDSAVHGGSRAMVGESASNGSIGWVALTDDDEENTLRWVAVSGTSNPFHRVTLDADFVVATTTLELTWTFPRNAPQDVTIAPADPAVLAAMRRR